MLPASQNRQSSFLRPAALLLGAISILGQVLLMRELVTSFYGNEMIYALILAFWLFWVAVGSFLFDCFIKPCKTPQAVRLAFAALGGLLPATVVAARLGRAVFHIPTGEIVGLLPVGVMTFVLLAPLCLLCGGAYALLCRLAGAGEGNGGSGPGGKDLPDGGLGFSRGRFRVQFYLGPVVPVFASCGFGCVGRAGCFFLPFRAQTRRDGFSSGSGSVCRVISRDRASGPMAAFAAVVGIRSGRGQREHLWQLDVDPR